MRTQTRNVRRPVDHGVRGHRSQAPQPGRERQTRQDHLRASPRATRRSGCPRSRRAFTRIASSPALAIVGSESIGRGGPYPAPVAPIGRIASGVELSGDFVVARALCLQSECAGALPHQGMKPVNGADCARQRVDQHVARPTCANSCATARSRSSDSRYATTLAAQWPREMPHATGLERPS